MPHKAWFRLFNAVKDYQAHAGDDTIEKYELNKMPLRQRAKLMAESKKEKFQKSPEEGQDEEGSKNEGHGSSMEKSHFVTIM